jgi:hypothetical protein
MNPSSTTLLKWLPLVVLAAAHLWLVQRCLSGIAPPLPPAACATPPLSTLALLALAWIELTRGSRLRGTLALAVVAFPVVMGMVAEGIN